MKKVLFGFISGTISACINMAFLLFAPDIKIQVFVSTAVTWIAIGILIAICDLKINGILNGIIIAVLVSASSLIYTLASSPSGAVWTLFNTVIWGGVIGFTMEKSMKAMNQK